jgi:hypothetical protein
MNEITEEYSNSCIDSMDKLENQRQENIKHYKNKFYKRFGERFNSLILKTQD